MSINRRKVLKGALAAGVATSALKVPAAVAQAGPIKVGFLTIKTGPLASGGLQMEQGLVTFFKERNNMLAGRPVELQTADTGGNPAQARTKTQELVERFNVHCIIGPLAAFEALAIDDYIRSSKTPILTVAGAEDMTQRKPNPWLVRAKLDLLAAEPPDGRLCGEGSEAQARDRDRGRLRLRPRERRGLPARLRGCGRQGDPEMFTPLNAPDYGTYVSQFKNADCLYTGHAGSNGLKLIRQISEYGLKGKFTIVGGFTPIDELVLQQMGEDGVGCYSGCWYSAALDNPINKKFVETIQRDYKVDPGVYAAETYLSAEVLEHALKQIGGKIEDKDTFMKALREAKVPATLSGPLAFDELGNVISNIYIRKVEKRSPSTSTRW